MQHVQARPADRLLLNGSRSEPCTRCCKLQGQPYWKGIKMQQHSNSTETVMGSDLAVPGSLEDSLRLNRLGSDGKPGEETRDAKELMQQMRP